MLLSELVSKAGEPIIVMYDGKQAALSERFKLVGLTPCTVQLRSARDRSDLFEAFRVGMRMPYTEIRNWDAFADTLTDLAWLDHGSFNFIIEGAESFFRRDPNTFRLMLNMVRTAGLAWSRPISEGQAWDRGPIPFHIYLDGQTGRHFPVRYPRVTG